MQDFFFYKFYFYFSLLQFTCIMMTAYSEEKKGYLGLLNLFLFLPTIDFWQICLLNRKKIAVALANICYVYMRTSDVCDK
jgi:hypothetical protein